MKLDKKVCVTQIKNSDFLFIENHESREIEKNKKIIKKGKRENERNKKRIPRKKKQKK